jgi:1-deoxy-D-xylulose-5-phosphate synthase
VFEALNNAGELEEDLVVILNDNKMSICPRVGSLASYLDRVRNSPYYTGLKNEVTRILSKVPVFGDPTERMLAQIKEAVKAGVLQGILFEELGLRYFGPIDGHDLGLLRKYLTMIRDQKGPVLLHVVTEKGHGYRPAAEDPVYFHTPPSFRDDNGSVIVPKKSEPPAYTNFARDAIQQRMRTDSKVTVITAAMCQGNKLEPVREEFPQRFFDVGICESHAVAFAAGQCKVGLRPIVDIYSTFLQRSFDQIFQEVALQDLPVVFMMDRAGLTGPDGPTHHGTYDIGYMRMFPNLIVMAPGYAAEMERMLEFALKQFHPVSIRYPKANALERTGSIEEIQLGRSETLVTGGDGTLLAFGAILEQTLQAAELLQQEGICLEVINARFAKPLDTEMLLRVWGKGKFIMTIEEGALMTGFGSAVLEAANQSGLDTRRLRCLGIPDRFVEHGERHELLELLGLSAEGIARACRREIDRQAGERFGPIVTPTSHQEHHHFVETVPVHE